MKLTFWMAAALLACFGPPSPASPQASSGRAPVVVELFTSEGCSDCPPAEALATQLERTQPVPGADVLVLAEHVDYFNSARWADRFSSPAFSARQEAYAAHFHLDSAYTPEMVVEGQTEFVGSDASRASLAVAAAAQTPQADVRLSRDGESLRVRITAFPTFQGTSDVLLAITEDGLRVHIGGGENVGRSLDHNAVVRSLRVIGSVTASPSAPFEISVPLPAFTDGPDHRVRAVVFVQERSGRRILGAGGLRL